jgi:hypothetical protein
MPLKRGSSRQTISDNISELYRHGSRPRSRKQIIAIAMNQARKSRRGRRDRRK